MDQQTQYSPDHPQEPSQPQNSYQPPVPTSYNQITTMQPDQTDQSALQPTQAPMQQNQNTWQQNSPAPNQQAPSFHNPPTTQQGTENKSNAAGIVLQWLTYGLWEWALGALCILLSATLSYLFIASTRSNDYSWLVYVLATMLVLLPFAFVLDRVYLKKEPTHKQGFSGVVMVINAVLVFLAAIGGLITTVVSVLRLLLSATSSSTTYIVIVSSLVVSVLNLLLFLRIMHFPKLHKFSKIFPFIIVGIAGLTAILAIIGPFRGEVALKNDRLIEKNLPTVNSAIQEYVSKNKKLPSALSELDLSSSYEKDAKALIDKDMVEYTKKDSTSGTDVLGAPELLGTTKTRSTTQRLTSAKFYYELCVTYKKASGNENKYDFGESSNYISTYNHKAGRQCYDKYASIYEY